MRGRDLVQPAGQDVTKEEIGANSETDKQFILQHLHGAV